MEGHGLLALVLAFVLFGGSGPGAGFALATDGGTDVGMSAWMGWNTSTVSTSMLEMASTTCEDETSVSPTASVFTSSVNSTMASPYPTYTPSTSGFSVSFPGDNCSTSVSTASDATFGVTSTPSVVIPTLTGPPYMNSTATAPNSTYHLTSYITKTVYEKTTLSSAADTTVLETSTTIIYSGTVTYTSDRSLSKASSVLTPVNTQPTVTSSIQPTVASSTQALVCSQLNLCTDLATIKGLVTEVTYVCASTHEISAVSKQSTVYTTVTDYTTTYPVSSMSESQGSLTSSDESSSSSKSTRTVTETKSITHFETHTVYTARPTGISTAPGIFYTPSGRNSSVPVATGTGYPIYPRYLADELQPVKRDGTTTVTVVRTTTEFVTVPASSGLPNPVETTSAESSESCNTTSTTTETVVPSSALAVTSMITRDSTSTSFSESMSLGVSMPSGMSMPSSDSSSTAGSSSTAVDAASSSSSVTMTASTSRSATGYYPGESTLAMGQKGNASSSYDRSSFYLVVLILIINAWITV